MTSQSELVVQPNLRQVLQKGDENLLIRQLTDREWRLNNLYWTVNEDGLKVRFRLRPAQQRLLREMHWRNIILKARQLGFTTFIDIFGCDLAIWNDNIRGAIIAHTREDASLIFRDKVKIAYDALPSALKRLRPALKNDAGELLMANNSSIRVTTGVRSQTMQFLHISELAKIAARYPGKAREIVAGAIPAIHQSGFLFVESTAEGTEGHFHDMCQQAQELQLAKTPLTRFDLKFFFYPWYEHRQYRLPVKGLAGRVMPERLRVYFEALEAEHGLRLDPGQKAWYVATERQLGDDMKKEHPATVEEAFEASIEGAYYKQWIDKAYGDGRIGTVPYDKGCDVDTFWDIGYDDQTAIWFVQFVGNMIHLIDYVEHSGEDLGFYADVLRDRKYRYGRYVAPFDMAVHDWATGKTRIEVALTDFGMAFDTAPKLLVADGIDAVRRLFRRCRFDESKCEGGLKSLKRYRKEWNDAQGCWKKTPFHGPESHGADAFRTMAQWENPDAGEAMGVDTVDDWAR